MSRSRTPPSAPRRDSSLRWVVHLDKWTNSLRTKQNKWENLGDHFNVFNIIYNMTCQYLQVTSRSWSDLCLHQFSSLKYLTHTQAAAAICHKPMKQQGLSADMSNYKEPTILSLFHTHSVIVASIYWTNILYLSFCAILEQEK